jgi:hypothetical protein
VIEPEGVPHRFVKWQARDQAGLSCVRFKPRDDPKTVIGMTRNKLTRVLIALAAAISYSRLA